jgi:sugar transferase (PEP-CTERM/EpsH1 system associated)
MNNPPLIAHIIHRLDFGGLENGLVNLINRIPEDRFHHAIICMTDYSDFAKRIANPHVTLHALHKTDGKDAGVYLRLWRLLRKLKPEIVHTRNLAALEGCVVARLAGVRGRVHGEHGRDSYDIDGKNRKYNLLRRACQPFVNRYIPLSRDLEEWLLHTVKIPVRKIRQIHNGVDSQRFSVPDVKPALPVKGFSGDGRIVVGTVGRLQEVKDQLTLVRAFTRLLQCNPYYRDRLRLTIVGDGPMRAEVEALVQQEGVTEQVWIAGARNDIPMLMQSMDIFVLPSKAEGISNTILEAMATGLPVVATSVGGNPELVVDGVTGTLAPPQDAASMAQAIEQYLLQPQLMHKHGQAGRKRIEMEFSMEAMVNKYMAVYDEVMR